MLKASRSHFKSHFITWSHGKLEKDSEEKEKYIHQKSLELQFCEDNLSKVRKV